jgi:hypothetical protein
MDSEKMSNTNIQKHTLNLRAGDWDYIESVAKPKGIATSEVIRALVRDLVDRWKKNEESEMPDVDAKL